MKDTQIIRTVSGRVPSKPEMQRTNQTVKLRDYSDSRFEFDLSKIEERVLVQMYADRESETKAAAARAAAYINGAATPDERRMRKVEVYGLLYNAEPRTLQEKRK